MNDEYVISKFVKQHKEQYMRVYSLTSKMSSKITFNSSEFSKTYCHELVRQYSVSGVLLTHLISESDFKVWFNFQTVYSIYAAIKEGSFGFSPEVLQNANIASLQRQFGPRQYLQSFPAFSIFAPINYFHLVGSVNSYISSAHRISHAIEQSIFDLQSGNTNQVIIAASNIHEGKEDIISEGVFFVATNSSSLLGALYGEIVKTTDEKTIYSNPIHILSLGNIL